MTSSDKKDEKKNQKDGTTEEAFIESTKTILIDTQNKTVTEYTKNVNPDGLRLSYKENGNIISYEYYRNLFVGSEDYVMKHIMEINRISGKYKEYVYYF